MKILYNIIGCIFFYLKKVSKKSIAVYHLKKFKKIGKNSTVGDLRICSYQNIEIGDNVSIGENAVLMSSDANIIIGSNIIIAPNVTIITGNHRIDAVGKYICQTTDKLPENDEDVIIEDDVWIGSGVIILKGVKISRGSVVSAGAVVTKSFPAYSIIGGVPAKVIKQRFNEDTMKEHEKLLNISNKVIT